MISFTEVYISLYVNTQGHHEKVYALSVVVAVLAGKREDKAGSKDVVATALPRSVAPESCCGRVLLLRFSLSITIFGPKQINRYIEMEGILQNKQPYETLKVQVVNFTEENSILVLSDYLEAPLD
ncbi:MAG: hypothetical protein IK119_07125 [Bacteroidales bacterium]|nr:hypothetical protein [Bacteroidales bacterium]